MHGMLMINMEIFKCLYFRKMNNVYDADAKRIFHLHILWVPCFLNCDFFYKSGEIVIDFIRAGRFTFLLRLVCRQTGILVYVCILSTLYIFVQCYRDEANSVHCFKLNRTWKNKITNYFACIYQWTATY